MQEIEIEKPQAKNGKTESGTKENKRKLDCSKEEAITVLCVLPVGRPRSQRTAHFG